MSDTAAELRNADIRPLVLDDSTGRALTMVNKITDLDFSDVGISNPRFGKIHSVQLFQPDNSMTIGLPYSLGLHKNSGSWVEPLQSDVSFSIYGPMIPPILEVDTGIIYVHENVSYKRDRSLANETVYLVPTNYDAIWENAGHRLLFDGAFLGEPLGIGHLLGGFEPIIEDMGDSSEFQSEDEEQLEVAIELEANFPPKNTRTVIGMVGARLKAPFKTAFSAELPDSDGA